MQLDYFKDDNLRPLFLALKEKYIKTSKLSGSVIVLLKTEEEASKISRFISQNIKVNVPSKIKINKIEKSILNTKFAGVSLLEIINYLYPNIKTNNDLKIDNINYKNDLMKEFKSFYNRMSIKSWFDINLDNKDFYNKVMNILIHNKELMNNIVSAIEKLSNNELWFNLSIFASSITGDPHYFDLDGKNLNNLIWFLAKYLDLEDINTRSFKIDVLNQVGVYVDNYSNFVMTYNFLGDNYLDDLNKRGEVAILNLDNILKLKNIYAKNKKVIILENPSLLASIVNLKSNCAFIISSGNPNIAVYKLLDKLDNHEFYYNGDFDPEGLLIADKLKKKYQEQLRLFLYNKECYEDALSNNNISELRLKKLEKVDEFDLKEVKNLILKVKKAGYQEKILDKIIDFILEID